MNSPKPPDSSPASAKSTRVKVGAALSKVKASSIAPDSKTALEKAELENAQPHLFNERLGQDNKQSRLYGERAFVLVRTWVVFLMALIAAQFVYGRQNFGLTEKEFVTVVVSLTGSVFGFWYLVGRYLFPSNDPGKADKKVSDKSSSSHQAG